MHTLQIKMPSAIGKIKKWLFKEKGKPTKENVQSFPEINGTPTKIRRSIEGDGTESLGLNFPLESESPPRRISEHSSLAPRELLLPPEVDVDDFELHREDGFLNRALRAIRSEPVLADDHVLEKAYTAMQKNTLRETLVIEAVIELRERLHCPKCKSQLKRKAGRTGTTSKLWCHNKTCEAVVSHLEILHQVPASVMKAILLRFGQRQFLEMMRKVPGVRLDKLEELEALIPGCQKKQSGLDQFFISQSKSELPNQDSALEELPAQEEGKQAKSDFELQTKVNLPTLAAAKPLPEKPANKTLPMEAESQKVVIATTIEATHSPCRTPHPRGSEPSPTRIRQRPKAFSLGSGEETKENVRGSPNPFASLQEPEASVVANLVRARPEFVNLTKDEVIAKLWKRLQEVEKGAIVPSVVEEIAIPEPKPKSNGKVSTFHDAALKGGKALRSRIENFSPRNRPITKREALKVIDTPSDYRPPPLETIHLKGFRFGQIANVKKIFREAGVQDGEARDFDFVGSDILEVIVLKPAAEKIVAKVNALCAKFPDRFKHLNVHQIQFDCLDQSNIRRNDIVATPKELLKKRLARKIARLEEGVKQFPFLKRTLNYVKKQYACENLNIQYKESVESQVTQIREEVTNDPLL
jgi:hypothetical protein